MEGYTIAEEYVLPSEGKIYNTKVNPNIRLRSMTTEEEMKRLSHSKSPFKLFSEIIDDCLLDQPGISSYDMCIGDYQYLMHKLRVVTYGSDYTVIVRCPKCGAENKHIVDLDSFSVVKYDENTAPSLNITLPSSKKEVRLRIQTPRIIDWVTKKAEELDSKSKNSGQSVFLFTLMSMIEKVDGEVLDELKLEKFIRKLPMKDSNYILQYMKKFDFGLQTVFDCECTNPSCNHKYKSNTPITGEFFGPEID
jgi:hypothetical protein